MPSIVTRSAARSAGLKKYFTGKACKRGHISERWVCSATCFQCWSTSGKAWRKANPEAVRANNEAHYAANREERLAKQKEYTEQNKDAVLTYQRAYRAAHCEEHRARARANYLANRERYIAHARNREISERASGRYTAAEISEIFQKQKGKCAYCRADLKKVRRNIDHIMPIKLGGENTRKNLQLLCKPCNARKSAKHPIAFAQELGLLL